MKTGMEKEIEKEFGANLGNLMEIEQIGQVGIDNGVYINLYITEGGLRWSFVDIRERDEEVEEPELYVSCEMVRGLAIERGYSASADRVNPKAMICEMVTRKVMDKLGISYDEAAKLLQ